MKQTEIYKVWHWVNGFDEILYKGKSYSRALKIRRECSAKDSPILSNF